MAIPEPLLGEPAALERLTVADPADDRVSFDLYIRETDRGMAVRVVVGELGVIDKLDARRVGRDQEQRRELVGTVDHVGHHDQHPGDVTGGDEPLLAVDPPAAVGRVSGRGDPGGIRAGLGLGDGVCVATLAAKRGRDVALDLLRRALEQHVVDVRDVPVQAIGDAPELFVDEEPLEHRPPLAAVLDRDAAALQPRRDRGLFDPVEGVLGQRAGALLGLVLERHQNLFDERAGALAEVSLLAGQLVGGGGRRAHPVPL